MRKPEFDRDFEATVMLDRLLNFAVNAKVGDRSFDTSLHKLATIAYSLTDRLHAARSSGDESDPAALKFLRLSDEACRKFPPLRPIDWGRPGRIRLFGHNPKLPNDGSRRFVAFINLTSWSHISLGLHVSLAHMNVEVHLPFCFIKVGFDCVRNARRTYLHGLANDALCEMLRSRLQVSV